MQHPVHNRAAIRVASSMDISGRATADEINRGLQTGKETSFWRIASLIILGCLTVAGFLIAVAPLSAHADNDKDSRHEREDNDKGIRGEITALQATVSALQDQVNTLQTANTDLQKEVTTLQSQLTAVQSNHALLLGPFVSVDPNPEIGVRGPNIIFSGANIHIVSGSGSTDDGMALNPNPTPTGLGNLIIGYDEDPGKLPVGTEGPPPPTLAPGDRGGSHNLVIGRWNRFTKAAFGGLVAGEFNLISNEGASVSGGYANTASGFADASVSGGNRNIASGSGASVSGGYGNIASGFAASVLGGASNTASNQDASVSGGAGNTASGVDASVSGGELNTASGKYAAADAASVVLGGQHNTAGGFQSVVIGGQNVINNKDNSIAPQPPFP